MWAGMRKITGMKQRSGDQNLADNLNRFFHRFDSPVPPQTSHSCPLSKAALSLSSYLHITGNSSTTATHQSLALAHPSSPPLAAMPTMLQPFQVIRELVRLKQGKALGPDDISPRLLKTCAVELGDILTHLF